MVLMMGGEVGMIDLEKVIHGLEIQLDDLQKYADNDQPLTLTQERAQEIISMLKEQESVIEALKSDLDETLKVLGEQPDIVRCKDCKYWRTNTEFCMCWSVANAAHHTNPNWFCTNGERKSNLT